MNKLWRTRLFYFLLFSANGLLLPFMNLFLLRQGMNGNQIGLIVTAGAIIGIVAAPLAAHLSSRFNTQKKLISIGLILSTIIQYILGQQSNFLPLLLASGLFMSIFVSYTPLTISFAQKIIQNSNHTQGFGSIRLFGALGWSLITLTAGKLIETHGIQIIFFLHVLFSILAVFVLHSIQDQNSSSESHNLSMVKSNYNEKLLVQESGIVWFAICMFIIYATSLGINQFEPIFMDSLGSQEGIIGFSFSISAFVEIPFMLWADRVIKRFESINIILFGFVLNILRLGLLVLFPTITMILIGRMIAGMAFGMFYIAMTEFIRERVPEEQNTTLQAIFNVSLGYIATILLGPIVGNAYDKFGGYIFYPVSLAGFIISMTLFTIFVRKKLINNR